MPPRIVARTAGLLLLLLACAGPVRAANAERPLVVGSIRPLYLIVLAVAGNRVDARQLLDAGSSAHDFALRPSQLRLLSDARSAISSSVSAAGTALAVVKPDAKADVSRRPATSSSDV